MADNVVILGITPTTALIFDEEFPNLKKVDIEPYAITYSKTLPLMLKLLLDSRRILNVIKKEKQQISKYIQEFNIDVVISDNRFGLSNSLVECVYVTHQLNIVAGMFSEIANKIHHNYIRQFDEIWVPDYENNKECLAGKLSRNPALKNVKYIGPLSRLEAQPEKTEAFDYLCLLSGPEPQRTLLEEVLVKKAENSTKKIVVVRGTKHPFKNALPENIKLIDLPNAKELSQLIKASDTIICRSGYSTLMDIKQLGKEKFILIPTPGQAEQAYLADYWKEKFQAKIIEQNDLSEFNF